MVILLIGKSGMVGWELHRSLQPLGEVVALGRAEADLSKPESLRKFVQDIQPDVIVNAAAYTAVDKAEDEEELATIINGTAPAVLAEEAKRHGALLVHYSTDYVFDGTKDSPYLETDIPNPINAYGRSKLAGEQAIAASGADHLIFRTSWVYAARGHNFLLTMLRLMQEREELSVVADQFGAPTWARTIADETAHCIQQAVQETRQGRFNAGIYHLVAQGETTWQGFARSIASSIERSGLESKIKDIRAITTAEYPVRASRPLNSRLSTDKFRTHFALSLPAWDKAVSLCFEELPGKAGNN